MHRFSPAVFLTLGAAALALLSPLAMKHASESTAHFATLRLQGIWLAGLLWSLLVQRKSLWLLASAPFALFWPWGLLLAMTVDCGFNPCD